MAEIKEGILGGVHGKIGPVVGFMWRGRYFLRSTPRKSSKGASEKQVAQRSKLSLVSTFANKVKDFVNANYPLAMLNDKMATGKEQLISMLLKEGVSNIEGRICIDISTVLLSIGILPPAVIKKINRLKTGRIKVLWDNSITNVLTKDTDRLTIIAYSEKLLAFKQIESIAKREDKYVHFDLPETWIEGNVHFWSVWKSADGKLVSTSAYHGVTELNQAGEDLVAKNGEVVIEKGKQEIGNVKLVSESGEQVVGNEELKIINKELTTGNEVKVAANKEQKIEGESPSSSVAINEADVQGAGSIATMETTSSEVLKPEEKELLKEVKSASYTVPSDYEPRSVLEALRFREEQDE